MHAHIEIGRSVYDISIVERCKMVREFAESLGVQIPRNTLVVEVTPRNWEQEEQCTGESSG